VMPLSRGSRKRLGFMVRAHVVAAACPSGVSGNRRPSTSKVPAPVRRLESRCLSEPGEQLFSITGAEPPRHSPITGEEHRPREVLHDLPAHRKLFHQLPEFRDSAVRVLIPVPDHAGLRKEFGPEGMRLLGIVDRENKQSPMLSNAVYRGRELKLFPEARAHSFRSYTGFA